MAKTKITLSIDKNNDITVKNSRTNTSFVIKYTNKTVNAKDVYNVFDLDNINDHEIESDINSVAENNIQEYYSAIVKLFSQINDELSKIEVASEASKEYQSP